MSYAYDFLLAKGLADDLHADRQLFSSFLCKSTGKGYSWQPCNQMCFEKVKDDMLELELDQIIEAYLVTF